MSWKLFDKWYGNFNWLELPNTISWYGKVFGGIQFSGNSELFFCNKHTSFLTFNGPQLYNSEALPFTYDQYVVIELADKCYSSVTVCFCESPWIFIHINNFTKLPAQGIEPLTLGLQSQRRNSRLLHIEYWAFHCTDSFSMDWITVKFIGCGVTVFAVQICLYFCHFWSNSDFSKTPITPQVSCHVLVMSWEHNDSIFDASLVAKWLHIWNVCSAICITKMSVSWRVLVRFWLFKNPYESSCVLPCPGHVLDKSWVCPGHVQAMSVAPSNSLLMIFFQFFSNFFFFAKTFIFFWKVGYTLPC